MLTWQGGWARGHQTTGGPPTWGTPQLASGKTLAEKLLNLPGTIEDVAYVMPVTRINNSRQHLARGHTKMFRRPGLVEFLTHLEKRRMHAHIG